MNSTNEHKFLLQQGYQAVTRESSESQYRSLLFQPVIVGSGMLVAFVFQSAPLFLVFSVILWINTLFPGYNPFERVFFLLFRKPIGLPAIEPAPPPRRFMQAMAATLMLISGLTLLNGYFTISYITQGFIAVAFSALLFGKFCVGAFLYHLLRGNGEFAKRTSPWGAGQSWK